MTFEELCYKHGMNFQDLVKASGLPRSSLAYLMSGSSNLLGCQGKTLYILAQVFGMTMEELMLAVDSVPEKEQEARELRRENYQRREEFRDNVRQEIGAPPVKRREKHRYATRESLTPVATMDAVTEKHIRALEKVFDTTLAKRSKALRDALEAAIVSLREVTRLREKIGSAEPSEAILAQLKGDGERTDGQV